MHKKTDGQGFVFPKIIGIFKKKWSTLLLSTKENVHSERKVAYKNSGNENKIISIYFTYCATDVSLSDLVLKSKSRQ